MSDEYRGALLQVAPPLHSGRAGTANARRTRANEGSRRGVEEPSILLDFRSLVVVSGRSPGCTVPGGRWRPGLPAAASLPFDTRRRHAPDVRRPLRRRLPRARLHQRRSTAPADGPAADHGRYALDHARRRRGRRRSGPGRRVAGRPHVAVGPRGRPHAGRPAGARGAGHRGPRPRRAARGGRAGHDRHRRGGGRRASQGVPGAARRRVRPGRRRRARRVRGRRARHAPCCRRRCGPLDQPRSRSARRRGAGRRAARQPLPLPRADRRRRRRPGPESRVPVADAGRRPELALVEHDRDGGAHGGVADDRSRYRRLRDGAPDGDLDPRGHRLGRLRLGERLRRAGGHLHDHVLRRRREPRGRQADADDRSGAPGRHRRRFERHPRRRVGGHRAGEPRRAEARPRAAGHRRRVQHRRKPERGFRERPLRDAHRDRGLEGSLVRPDPRDGADSSRSTRATRRSCRRSRSGAWAC